NPPLIDSTRYFFSGEATCLKLMPDCVVTSMKRIAAGWAPVNGVKNASSRQRVRDFRPGGTLDISRWRNHRNRAQGEIAPWKGAGPKLWSRALSGLEEFWR